MGLGQRCCRGQSFVTRKVSRLLKRSHLLLLLVALLGLSATVSAAALFNFTLPWNDSTNNALSAASLNDHVAGSRGYLSVSAAGHLQAGGQRIRFWGANLIGPGAFQSYGDAEVLARRLAKLGYNIVRWHHMDNDWGTGSIWADSSLDRALNPDSQDKMDYLFNQLKQQGIYSNINLVVSRPFNPGTELDPSISLITDVKIREALGFFDPAALQLQKNYAHDLLTHVNPYTGMSYTQDPAVAIVEVNNENGMVQAWMSQQFDNLPSYYSGLLNTAWNQWLVLKYGSEPLLESAWGITNTALGAEMLSNGDFSSGTSGWNYQLSGSPAATGSATVQPDGAGATNVARLIISSAGQQAWHAQFIHSGLAVTAGTAYTLGFWAKASSARSIEVTLMRDYGDYGEAGFDSFPSLGTGWQYYQFVFSPSVSDSNLRLNFGNMGLQTGTVWVGDVTLKPGGLLGLYADEALGGAGIHNFLRGNETVGRTTEASRDWLRFLLQTEETYWLAMRDYLKNTLGVKALLMGTVQGCSTPNLQANFDLIDNHFYWKHPSFPSTPWDSIDWYVENKAMVDDPAASSVAGIGVQAVYGKPQSVTELNAPYPNSFEADIMLVTAAYGGFNDWDAIYPFDYWGESGNFSSSNIQDYFTMGFNPVKQASQPGAAMAFRRGDFSPASQLVTVPVSRSDEVEQLLTSSSWKLVNASTAGEDARAPLVHAVRQLIQGQTAPGGALGPGVSGPYGADIAADSGQLHWLTGGVGGLVTGDSPRSQFVAGFMNGRTVALGCMTVSAVSGLLAGDYAMLSLSSHDGLPLTATASALLTLLGTQRNTGSTYYQYPNTPISFPPSKGINVTLRNQWGTGPVQVEGVSATVTLAYAPSDVQVYALLPDGSRGTALPITNVGGQAQVQLGAAYSTLFYEVAVSRPAYSPTPTQTDTPMVTATPTRTITPTPSATAVPASVVWEDMETGAIPASWQAYADTSSGAILGVSRVTGTAAASGGFADEVHLNTGSAGNWGGGFLINSSYGTKPSLGWRDLSGMQVLHLKVWTDQANFRVRPVLNEAGNTTTAVNGADGENWEASNGAWTILPANTWVDLVFPLSAFRDKPNDPYNPTSLGDNTFDLSAIAWITLAWDGNQGSDVTLRIDDVVLVRDLSTPTASPSVSPSFSASPSATSTATITPTATQSPTASVSPTLTASATVSATSTTSATASASPSLTPSLTASPSSTPSPSSTQTVTPAAATLTPSATAVLDSGGELRVLEQRFMPQPLRGNAANLYFNLQGGASDVVWQVYSPAAVLIQQQTLTGPFPAGWSRRLVAIPDLPGGLLYSVISAQRGSQVSTAQKEAIYLLK